jgi:hypothetical protein
LRAIAHPAKRAKGVAVPVVVPISMKTAPGAFSGGRFY